MAKYVFLDGNKTDSRYGYFVGNKWIVKVGLRTESDDSYDIGCKSCLALAHSQQEKGQIPFNIQHPEIIASALTLNIILQFSAGPPFISPPPAPSWR